MNRIILQSIYICLLLTISTNSIFSQFTDRPPIVVVGTVVVDGNGGNGTDEVALCLDENDLIDFTLVVEVVNLTSLLYVDTSIDPFGIGIYGLPETVPDMYLKFSIDGINFDYIPVTEFQDLPMYLFEAQINVGPFDFSSQCERGGVDGEFELEDFFVQLVTTTPEVVDNETGLTTPPGYEAYPILEYSGIGEIFGYEYYIPCEERTNQPCDDAIITTFSSRIILQCDCDTRESNPRKVKVKNFNSIATINPNPVVDFFKINFEKIDNYNISLLGTNGSIHKTWNVNKENGSSIYCNVNGLASGLYFLQIKSENDYQVIKLLIQ